MEWPETLPPPFPKHTQLCYDILQESKPSKITLNMTCSLLSLKLLCICKVLIIENVTALKVLKAHKQDHVSPLLRTLHWLPIQARIEYKLSTLCHSFFSDTAPVYLSDLLCVYSPSRQLHSSSDSRTLRIPHIKTKTSRHHSLSHAAPSVWNSLPHEIRHVQSATAFKTASKTHLFKSYLC